MIRIIFCFLAFYFIAYITYAQSSSPLIITEIMPDPTPARGLPEVEYVEIFNTTDQLILLSEFTFVYQQTRVPLPAIQLQPQQYALLVRTSFTPLFEKIPILVVPIARLSLTNTGSLLQLVQTNTNEVVHEVQYAPDWGETYLKGGYSLEMIDERYPCVEKANWGSTKSETGGTPGQPNSIRALNPDISPPTYLYYTLTRIENGETQLSFEMSEKLEVQSMGEIKCDFGIKNSTISPSRKQIHALLTQEIPASTSYTCQLSNWSDCSGNSMSDTSFVVGFFREPKFGELVFSELLFNPYENGEKFVELTNVSNEIVSLKSTFIAQKNADGVWEKGEEIIAADWIIKPNGYAFLSKNKVKASAPYRQKRIENGIDMPRFPSMPQTEGTLGIFTSRGILLDEVHYSETQHHPSLVAIKGVSLEKSNIRKSSLDINNWLSASTLSGYATPGVENSQNQEQELVPPHIWWVDFPVFSKSNPSFPQKMTLKYALEGPGTVAKIDILRADGTFFQRLHSSILLGVSGEIDWDGAFVQSMETGHYFFHITYFDTRGRSEVALVKMVYVNE